MNVTKLKTAAWALCLTTLSLTVARADDGGVSFGGMPRLLHGSKTVSMRSEVVRMRVGPQEVHVDCRFVFQNSGPACTVRMGFPDQGRGSQDPEEEGPQRTPSGTFLSYASEVNGVRVPTQTIRGDGPGQYWHVKTVRFAAGQTLSVHDVYALDTGAQISAVTSGSYQQTYYILHTASSWRGSIGQGQVIVTFAPGAVRAPITAVPLASVGNDPDHAWSQARPGLVVYRGPVRPTVRGDTLRFDFTDLRPAYLDDILLYFHYAKFKPT